MKESPGAQLQKEVDDILKTLRSGNNLEIMGLHLLMEVANKKLGTNYVLGFIYKGYRVRWGFPKKKYDDDIIAHHNPIDQSPSENGCGDDKPILWIWNGNLEDEFYAHRISDKMVGHWCSFTSGKEISPTLQSSLQDYRRKTEDWKIGNEELLDSAAAQAANGVWVVHSQSTYRYGHRRGRTDLVQRSVRSKGDLASWTFHTGRIPLCEKDE
jgi:hypothetical protein